jgi:hypothetical protein
VKPTVYFSEKQYLGMNFFSIILRTIITLFCFVAYYWSENPNPVYTDIGNFRIGSYPAKEIPKSGEIFFLLGNVVLLFSVLLIFIKHIKITITDNYLMIERLWSKSLIKIDLNTINYIKKVDIENVYLQRTVFNVHKNNSIRFYTSGDEAIELVDKDNMRYSIGTAKAGEMAIVIEDFIKNKRNTSK